MQVQIKRLRWAGDYAHNIVCNYHVYHVDEGRYKAESATFQWYEDKIYNNKKAAMEACQRHYAKQITSLLEGDEDEL